MSNKITPDTLSNYEKLLIIAAREADERAREDALNLLKSRKVENKETDSGVKMTKDYGFTRGAEYYKKSKITIDNTLNCLYNSDTGKCL